MKLFKYFSICFLGLFFLSFIMNSLQAQAYTKGRLKMEVEKIILNGEEAPVDMGAHLGDISLQIFSDGNKQKTSMSMMMMKTETFYDPALDSVKMYMDLMGKKYLVADSRSSINQNNKQKGIEDKLEIKEMREDTKEILGYKCYRVDVKMKAPGEGASLEVDADLDLKLYVTEQLKFDASYITNGKQSINLKGTPLEYNMKMGSGNFAMEMIMVAKEFSKEISEKDFEVPQGNYKIYTSETFQKEMSQMKGR
ncbi:MAG: hypothetical protein IPM34_08285 [Saprospiraceae bacterium]|nr:hypothetical protein [Saprospiraceae bacterium]